jgi:hypothetical protein
MKVSGYTGRVCTVLVRILQYDPQHEFDSPKIVVENMEEHLIEEVSVSHQSCLIMVRKPWKAANTPEYQLPAVSRSGNAPLPRPKVQKGHLQCCENCRLAILEPEMVSHPPSLIEDFV